MKQIPIFRVTGIFLVLVFLCSVLFGCGGTGSAADDAYLTQVTASVTEAQSLIDEMISFSNEMTEATGTFSENKDSDAYVEQCRTKLTLLEEKVAVVQELQQQIEKSGAPSSDLSTIVLTSGPFCRISATTTRCDSGWRTFAFSFVVSVLGRGVAGAAWIAASRTLGMFLNRSMSSAPISFTL